MTVTIKSERGPYSHNLLIIVLYLGAPRKSYSVSLNSRSFVLNSIALIFTGSSSFRSTEYIFSPINIYNILVSLSLRSTVAEIPNIYGVSVFSNVLENSSLPIR